MYHKAATDMVRDTLKAWKSSEDGRTTGQRMTTFINGRFLTQKVSGVQRFGRELTKALDQRLSALPQDPHNTHRDDHYILLAPPGTTCDLALQSIEFRVAGKRQGHAWEQLDLLSLTRRDVLVNLCNSGPALHPTSFTIIHDAMIYRTPQNYSSKYRLGHKLLDKLVSLRSHIGTVSEFSKRELTAVLHLKSVFVVPNGCDHLKAVLPDTSVLERFKIKSNGYFMCVGSPTANKNLILVIKALELLGDKAPRCIVVGSPLATIYDTNASLVSDRVTYTGRLSDEAVVGLYANALALIFPSLYEGFGIPPLEAMLQGCPVIASSIPPLHEVCDDCAMYVDPHNPVDLAEAITSLLGDSGLRTTLSSRGKQRAAEFTWDKSATALLREINSHNS